LTSAFDEGEPFKTKLKYVLFTINSNSLLLYSPAFSYARYHPSKGYWWEFKDSEKKGNKVAFHNCVSEMFTLIHQITRLTIICCSESHFSSLVPKENVKKSKKEKSRTAPSSLFQRQHVDLLLEELIKKFPPQRVKVRPSSTRKG
jgi:mediator of RNA polymerase II transcription subunit 6